MPNHPGRRPPAWVADAQAAADERIAATQWPPGTGAHVLTSAELQQALREAMVWAYGQGRRSALAIIAGVRHGRR